VNAATAVAPQMDTVAARATLREFAEVCDTHDPTVLASLVEDFRGTLKRATRMESWLKQYVQAVRERRPQ